MKNKKQIFIYLTLFLLLFLVAVIIFNLKFNNRIINGFTNNDRKTIILLGDSILNNSNYVDSDSSVSALIKKTRSNDKVLLLAQDNAKVSDVYKQVDSIIGTELDSKNTYIFLSVGGNNMLDPNFTNISDLKQQYFKLVSYIRNNFSKSKIFLIGLYYPFDERFKKHTTNINSWNKIIKNLGYNYIMLDGIITNKSDLVFSIEPSAIGGQKIANEICFKI